MAREVFVDAAAWIALSVERDQWHQAARGAYRELVQATERFVTTNLVIAESYVMIRSGAGHEFGMRFLRSLRTSPRVQIVRPDFDIELDAEGILGQFSDQAFSYADAVSFSVMRSLQLTDAFTFDRHFTVAGFQVIPALR